MNDMSLILPGTLGQIAVFRNGYFSDNRAIPCELVLIQPERVESGVLIPARTIAIRKVERIRQLNNFLTSVLAGRPADPY